jgi:hypothetical protein
MRLRNRRFCEEGDEWDHAVIDVVRDKVADDIGDSGDNN